MRFDLLDDRIQRLLTRASAMLVDYLRSAPDRDASVVRFAGPAELRETFRAAGAELALGAPQAPLGEEALLRAVELTLERSVRTQHPRFFDRNFAGADPVAVLGDWAGAALNTTAATYEMAPVFTLMEKEIVARLARVAGFAGGEGILNPGGSLSNLYALHLARCQAAPDALDAGQGAAPRLAAFTSAQSHFSLDRAMALAGLGRRALHKIPCDSEGRMRVDALAAAVREARDRGDVPFFLNATAGTTVVGAFDPLRELAALAREHSMWLHVDGCHGASALFSERHRALLDGVEEADSLVWNPHKMLGVTQQCSVLLVRRPGLLRGAFASKAAYLFQQDKNHPEEDLGEMTFQCARRVDSLKLWLTWKARGDAGFAARIDGAMDLAAHAAARVRGDDRFALAFPPSFTHVCFWWVPPEMRPLGDPREPAASARLHALTAAIKGRMHREGTLMLSHQPLAGLPNFFRLLIINPAVTRDDVDAALALIDRYGREAVAAGR